MSTDVGGVGTDTSPSVASNFATGFNDAMTNMIPLKGLTSALSGVGSSVLSNWSLIAVGVVLAVGALLISQKENITNVTVQAAKVASKVGAV